jgi:hypothetical protein
MKRELWYSVVVRDRHGKIVSRERRKSKSFLKQWNQLVYVQFSQASISITDTDGVARNMVAHSVSFQMNGPAGNLDFGLVVGTGETAVTINDYSLEALIAEGAGVGQLNYNACDVAAYVVSAPNCSFIVSRAAINNSGVLITVKESGLNSRCWDTTSRSICGVRDVFGTPQDVPDGGSIIVNYTMRVTA